MSKIPHLKTNPEYAAAVKERESLALALGKVTGRINEIEALLRVSAPAHERESSHVAAALHFAETGQVRRADNNTDDLHEEHLALRRQREALEKAVAAKTASMEGIAGELSAQVSRDLESKHRELAARYVALLQQLDDMHGEEEAFVREIESAGYSPRFRERIQWPLVGRLSQQSESNLWHHLRAFNNYAK